MGRCRVVRVIGPLLNRVSFFDARLPAIACLLLFVGACGGDARIPDNRMTFALGSDPQTFDPGEMSGSIEGQVAYQLYEGLVSPPVGDGPPAPGVAERWEMSGDALTWTFHLRDNARWSNGDPVVAEDFRYAWLRMLSGDVAADYVSFVRYLAHATAYELVKRRFPGPMFEPLHELALGMVGVEVPDSRTIVLRLQEPTPYLLDIVMFYALFPVHRGNIEEHGEDAFRPENIVSNGPFSMDNYERRVHVKLEQNEHYWDRENLGLDEVHFLIIEDNSARVTAFLDGRVDHMDDPPNDQLAFLAAMEEFHSGPQLGTYYYRFNVTDEVLSDVRVRRALSLALNREELCDCTLDSLYTAPGGFVPPIPGYTGVDLVRYDPREARRLLAEAGYPDGEGFPQLDLLYNTSENHRKIAEFVQGQWQVELGISVQLMNREWKVYLETMEDLDYQVARAGWIGDYVDPDTFLTLWRSFDENNNTGWENAEYDALIAAQLREQDPVRREALLRQAETLLLTEIPVMPIYYYSQFHLVSPNVDGWEMNVRDVHLARWISKRPSEVE
ncbi:MAG: oligopeptide transport system substrate-binding protein [Bradymonadia bacterium]